jgi:hypothetical protein
MKIKNILFVCALCCIAGCQKEGVGGKAIISGYVYENITDRNGAVIEQIPATKEDVFISYGDQAFYQDDATTDETGYFEFPFLRKGDYQLFVYGDCLDCDDGKTSVLKNLTIDSKKAHISNTNFQITKLVDYDDGSSSVKGRLMEQQYLGSTPFGTPYPSQENEVYVVYGNDQVYFDRMDTGAEGWFEFRELIKGQYTLYAFSECSTCANYLDTVSVTVTITDNNSTIEVGELKIEKR